MKPLYIVGDAHLPTISSCLRSLILHGISRASIGFLVFRKLLSYKTLCHLMGAGLERFWVKNGAPWNRIFSVIFHEFQGHDPPPGGFP